MVALHSTWQAVLSGGVPITPPRVVASVGRLVGSAHVVGVEDHGRLGGQATPIK
jgi:hypothetical protein